MESFFVSHKYSGLSYEEMDRYLGLIKRTLEGMGHRVFCSLYLTDWFDAQGWDLAKRYEWCCEQQLSYDITLGILWSSQDSYGMQLELDYALRHQKPYWLLIQKGAMEYERAKKYIESADSCAVFENVGDIDASYFSSSFVNLHS